MSETSNYKRKSDTDIIDEVEQNIDYTREVLALYQMASASNGWAELQGRSTWVLEETRDKMERTKAMVDELWQRYMKIAPKNELPDIPHLKKRTA